ncbi:MAG: DUF2007 domain-containing protein [Candidatus Thiodiazotropha sp. (ex Lucinoma borealis)]|nr:DUF2007 domain-containing protein [Candidatus Thiodiazotropha sp. (ex Lucinoma borealis)]MCU7867297.1 DUF2007 domain-containing protein [Candidatus Thiodiazotropha sp. (ex Lucinoma borealis)]
MKMLTRDSDPQYLNELKNRLEINGIPAVVQGENTARMIIPRFGIQPTLWVYLDEQYPEAIQLIENPEYKVKAQIDMAELKRIEPTEYQKRNQLNAALIHLLLYSGAIMLGIIAFIWFLEWLQT